MEFNDKTIGALTKKKMNEQALKCFCELTRMYSAELISRCAEQALKYYFVPKLISVFLNDGIISRILDPIVRSFLGHL